jgi:hypothetical protein
MAHVPRLIVVGYLAETQPPDVPVVELLRCGDCGALVCVGESQRMHLSWHRSHDNNGPGDASASSLAGRIGWNR